jgi:hypothetical protein
MHLPQSLMNFSPVPLLTPTLLPYATHSAASPTTPFHTPFSSIMYPLFRHPVLTLSTRMKTQSFGVEKAYLSAHMTEQAPCRSPYENAKLTQCLPCDFRAKVEASCSTHHHGIRNLAPPPQHLPSLRRFCKTRFPRVTRSRHLAETPYASPPHFTHRRSPFKECEQFRDMQYRQLRKAGSRSR